MLVAAVQFAAGIDPAANLDAAAARIEEAAANGARLVVLPEKWHALGGAAALQAGAVERGDATFRRLAGLARKHHIDLVAGSVSEQAGDASDSRLYNTALVFGTDGELTARYRKIHQFDADIEGQRYRESDAEQPGSGPVAVELSAGGDWVAGLAICFDLRFGGMFAPLAAHGVDLIAVPAAFTAVTTEAHWEPLLRARAIEHGMYVVAANQCGVHPSGFASGGRSMIVDPWGRVLAQAGVDREEVVYAELDADAVRDARAALPMQALSRPSAYREAVTDGLDSAANGTGASA